MVHRYISLAYLTYFSFTCYILICWQSVEEVDFALISSNLSSRNGISVREVLILKIADLCTSIPFDIIAIAIQTSSQAELLTFFPRSAKIICLLSGLQMAMRW